MALNIYINSVTENIVKRLDGESIIKSYDVSVYIAKDSNPSKHLSEFAVNLHAEGKTVGEMQTEFKDKIRGWWNDALEVYNREIAMRSKVNEAIAELIAE
jgi:hypothetical protein